MIILAVLFVILVIYAALVSASQADDWSERMFFDGKDESDGES